MPELYRRYRRMLRIGPLPLRLHSVGNPLRAATQDIRLTMFGGIDLSAAFPVSKRRKVLGAMATGRPCFVEVFKLNRQGRPYVHAGWPTHLGPTAWRYDCAGHIARGLVYVTITVGYGLRKLEE